MSGPVTRSPSYSTVALRSLALAAVCLSGIGAVLSVPFTRLSKANQNKEGCATLPRGMFEDQTTDSSTTKDSEALAASPNREANENKEKSATLPRIGTDHTTMVPRMNLSTTMVSTTEMTIEKKGKSATLPRYMFGKQATDSSKKEDVEALAASPNRKPNENQEKFATLPQSGIDDISTVPQIDYTTSGTLTKEEIETLAVIEYRKMIEDKKKSSTLPQSGTDDKTMGSPKSRPSTAEDSEDEELGTKIHTSRFGNHIVSSMSLKTYLDLMEKGAGQLDSTSDDTSAKDGESAGDTNSGIDSYNTAHSSQVHQPDVKCEEETAKNPETGTENKEAVISKKECLIERSKVVANVGDFVVDFLLNERKSVIDHILKAERSMVGWTLITFFLLGGTGTASLLLNLPNLPFLPSLPISVLGLAFGVAAIFRSFISIYVISTSGPQLMEDLEKDAIQKLNDSDHDSQSILSQTDLEQFFSNKALVSAAVQEAFNRASPPMIPGLGLVSVLKGRRMTLRSAERAYEVERSKNQAPEAKTISSVKSKDD